MVDIAVNLVGSRVRRMMAGRSSEAEAPASPAAAAAATGEPPIVPPLQEGYIQGCDGYLRRRSRVLRRWKVEWFSVQPGTCACVGVAM